MPFKVGDKVVAVERSMSMYALEVGKEYEVVIVRREAPPIGVVNGGHVRYYQERRFKLAQPEVLEFAPGATVERTGPDSILCVKGQKYIIETVYKDELGGVLKIKLQGINTSYHVRGFKVVAAAKAFNRAEWKPQAGEKVYIIGKDKYHASAMDKFVNDGKQYTITCDERVGGALVELSNEYTYAFKEESIIPVWAVEGGKPPAKPPKPKDPEDLRERLIREQGTLGGLCSFAFELKDGTRNFQTAAPCHARLDSYACNGERVKLAYNLPHQIHNLTHGMCKGKTTEEDHNYAVEWLISESPWAVAFLTKDIKEAVEKGLFMDVEQNRNVIASSCCALRSFMEFERATLFKKMKEMGFTGGTAFLIACAFGPDGLGGYSRKGMPGAHDTIAASQSFDGWIRFFKQGFHTEEGTLNEPFRTNHGRYVMAAACADGGGQGLYGWFNENTKAQQVGEGWNKKTVINEKSLFDVASKLDQLIKDKA